jgi:hypothetical protein
VPEEPRHTGDVESDLKVVARAHRAEQFTGGLSLPSIMPCPSGGNRGQRMRHGPDLEDLEKEQPVFGGLTQKLHRSVAHVGSPGS